MEHCERFLDLISQSLDGLLSEDEQQSLQQHLAQCPDCRLLAQQLSEIQSELGTWEEQEVPDGFTEGVMDRIRALDETPTIIPLWKRPQFKALGSIAACALLCAGIWRMGVPQANEAASLSVPTAVASDQTADINLAIPAETQAAAGESVSTTESGTSSDLSVQKGASSNVIADTAAPEAAMPESESTVYSTAPSEPQSLSLAPDTLPDEDALMQSVVDALGTTPGTLLLIDVIPQELEGSGTWHTTEDGASILVLESLPPDDVWQTLVDKALLSLEYGDGPLVLMLWN